MIYRVGDYIKSRRKALGVTQEELAKGVCSVITLSRIERGEQAPQSSTLISILQRLGLSYAEFMLDDSSDKLLLHQLKFDIRQAFILGDYEKASSILNINREWISKLEPLDRQTFERVRILIKIYKTEISDEEALSRLEAVMRLTCPKYSKDNLPTFLTYEEILSLNNIALRYANVGDIDTTIKLLYHIKSFYDKRVCDIEEALRTEPMILYNLSKFLGLAGRFDESISVCNQGIKHARDTGRCSHLAKTLYNLAYCLYEKNEPGDREASKHYANQAYQLAVILKKEKSAAHYKKFLTEKFERHALLL